MERNISVLLKVRYCTKSERITSRASSISTIYSLRVSLTYKTALLSTVSGLFHVSNGSSLSRASRCPPRCENKVGNIINSFAFFDAAEDGRTVPSHQL